MLRRHFLSTSLGAAAVATSAPTPPKSILSHEHVMVDFVGADAIKPGRYDPEEVFRAALPKLQEVRALGCRRLLECTPNFLGRDPRLLRRLSKAADIEIWTNTGLYGAADYKFLPAFAKTETAAQLAQRWITEARQGVDGEPVRFLKSGVNRGPLPALDRKLIEAAILTCKATGLTMAVHTGDGRAALDELEMVQSSGLPTRKWVWVHAQNEQDLEIHERVARAGGWVSLDGVNLRSGAWHLQAVKHMAKKGLLDRVLISQDSGWYRVGEPAGGRYNGYTFLYTEFLPRLEPEWRNRLLWHNPRAAFRKA
jgi:phosphotriesterase-related protein